MNNLRAQTHSLRRARAHFSILSLLGAIAGAALHAAPAAPDSGGGSAQRPARRENLKTDQRRPPGLLALFDTDHDGRLSAAEIAAAPAILRKLDTDGDGQLSGRELMPPRPPRPPGAPDMPPDGMPPGDEAPEDRESPRRQPNP